MFDNLCNFVKKELTDLDHRITANGKLTIQEIQYADLLAHFKKSLLTADAMERSGESYNDGYNRSYNDGYSKGYNEGYSEGYRESENSYNAESSSGYGARGRGKGARRDSMGRYAEEPRYNDSYQHDSMIEELHSLMEKAPNEQVKRKYSDFLNEIKGMM